MRIFFCFLFLFFFSSFISFGASVLSPSFTLPSSAVLIGQWSRTYDFSYDMLYGGTTDGVRYYYADLDPSRKYIVQVSGSLNSTWFDGGWYPLLQSGESPFNNSDYALFTLILQTTGGAKTTIYSPPLAPSTSYSVLLDYNEIASNQFCLVFWYYGGSLSVSLYSVSPSDLNPDTPGGGGDTGGGDTGGGDTGGGDTGGGDTGGGGEGADPITGINLSFKTYKPYTQKVETPESTSVGDLNTPSSVNNVVGVFDNARYVDTTIPERGTFVYPSWDIPLADGSSVTIDFAQGMRNSSISSGVETLRSLVYGLIFCLITIFFFIKVYHLFRKNS